MVDVEDLRTYLGAPASAESTLTLMEAAAVLWLEERTGRYFGETAEKTYFVDGNGRDRIFLPDAPAEIAEVRTRPTVASAWSDVMDPTFYELDRRSLYHLQGIWPAGRRTVMVIGDYGFEAGEEPADLRLKVMELVDLSWNLHGKAGISSESLEGFSISYEKSGSTLPGMMDVLAKYATRIHG